MNFFGKDYLQGLAKSVINRINKWLVSIGRTTGYLKYKLNIMHCNNLAH